MEISCEELQRFVGRELLALAISPEEEDGAYADFAEELRENLATSASVFDSM